MPHPPQYDEDHLIPDPEYLEQPEFWQNQFERSYDIPTAGRSPYQRWLANQWQRSATSYSLGQAFRDPNDPEEPVSLQNYSDYLSNRRQFGRGLPGSSLKFGRLANMDPTESRAMLENLPSYVAPTAFYQQARMKRPGFLARGMTSQAFDPAQRRAFDISEGGAAGDSFLRFLRNRFNI